MRSRWCGVLVLALALCASPAWAEAHLDIKYEYEAVQEYVCAHGVCAWKTTVYSLGPLTYYMSADSSEETLPLKMAVLNAEGGTSREVVIADLRVLNSCPATNTCPSSGLSQCMAQSQCSVEKRCRQNPDQVAQINGWCRPDPQVNCGDPGVTTRSCECEAIDGSDPCEIPPLPGGDPRPAPDPDVSWIVGEGEDGGSVWLAPCGANTPVLPGGECDEEGGEPCYACGGYLPSGE